MRRAGALSGRRVPLGDGHARLPDVRPHPLAERRLSAGALAQTGRLAQLPLYAAAAQLRAAAQHRPDPVGVRQAGALLGLLFLSGLFLLGRRRCILNRWPFRVHDPVQCQLDRVVRVGIGRA